MERRVSLFLAFLVIFATVSAVYLSVNYPLHGVLKFFLVIGELVASGMLLKSLLGLEGEYGALLLRDSRGLKFIDRLAKRSPEFWNAFADVGLVLGFGLFAFFLIRGKRKNLARNALVFLAGAGLLLSTSFFIAPHLFAVTSSVIFGIDVGAASAELKQVTQGSALFAWFAFAALALGGIATTAVVGILMKAGMVMIAVAQAILGNAAPLMQTSPGATLIVPGINLPLFEGILALAVLLVVHEGAHGVLARVAGIKLKSAGLVLLGVVPAGAFIDPDEDALAKKEETKQNRVLAAGSAANIFTSVLAFLLLLSFVFVTEGAREDALRIEPAAKIANGNVSESAVDNRSIAAGTLVYAIDGKSVGEIRNFTFGKDGEVSLLTNKGEVKVRTDKYGKLSALAPFDVVYRDGVALVVNEYRDGKASSSVSTWSFVWREGFGWLGFVYSLLGLVFVLNFLVGAINLMPIPVFDGHRILSLNLKNKLVVNIITALVLAGFIANFLPWLVR